MPQLSLDGVSTPDYKKPSGNAGMRPEEAAEFSSPVRPSPDGAFLLPLALPSADSINPSPSPSVSLPDAPSDDGWQALQDEFANQLAIDSAELSPELGQPIPLDCDPADASVPLKLETTGISGQPVDRKTVPAELWKKASIFKESVAAKLREAGNYDDAQSLDDCHSRRIYAQCDGCHGVRIFRNRCDQFFCPECQPKLARNRMKGVSWWAERIHQPKHVVLTVRNVPDLTKAHVKAFKQWISRLRHRKFCKNWRGGLYSLEITNEGRGWHLHAHLLVDAGFIDGGELSRQWASVSDGAGYIVKVKSVRDRDYLREVTKYTVEGNQIAGWTGREIDTFIQAFRGVKTFGVFGSLYGKRTEWRDWIASLKASTPLCPCGCDKLRYYDENEWLARDCTSYRPVMPTGPPAEPSFAFLKQPVASSRILAAFKR